jgi:tetratricopeptide (TPR) repeat protein
VPCFYIHEKEKLGIFDLQKTIFRYIFVDIGHNIFFTFSNTFQNQFQLAHGQQQTSIEIDPYYVNALDGKGWSLNELGYYSQAITYLDKVLEIDPKHIDALVFKSQALSNIGNYTGANYTGAKYYSDKAFETDPGSPALKRLIESPM